MNQLFADSQNIRTSAVYIGYEILKIFDKQDEKKLSIFSLAEELKKKDVTHSRQLIFGLSFLYSLDLIEFEEPYIWIK